MPAYNAADYIGQALDSLQAQTFPDWECVVVDDASTDRTAEIVETYAHRDSRIRCQRNSTNSGSAKFPRDTAISLAKGEWIVTLDADDTLAPEAIERLVDRQRETGADFVAPRMILTDLDLRPTGETIPKPDFDMTRVIDGRQAAMLTIGRWVIGANGALIDKRLWDGRKSTGLQMNADEYDTREMLLGSDKVAFVDTFYYYRRNPVSITQKISHKQFEQLVTDKMLVTLIDEHFGVGSTQHRAAERAFQYKLLAHYMRYAMHGKNLNKQGRKKAKRSILDAKKEAPLKKVLGSELFWPLKAILILPSTAIFVVARIACIGFMKKLAYKLQ